MGKKTRKTKKQLSPFQIWILVFIAVLFAALLTFKPTKSREYVVRYTPEPVYCTMDAKLCPDGTSVGRVGPKCDFAPCSGKY